MTKGTLHGPEFDVYSKSAVKIMVTTRNLGLQLPIETAGQASQLNIPTRADRTEPKFELAIELWPRKPKLVPGALAYGENEPQWLNSFLLV